MDLVIFNLIPPLKKSDQGWLLGKDYNSELACAGLTATLIVRIEEVTKEMLKNITPDMKDNQRRLIYDRNQNELLKIYKKTI